MSTHSQIVLFLSMEVSLCPPGFLWDTYHTGHFLTNNHHGLLPSCSQSKALCHTTQLVISVAKMSRGGPLSP